MSNDTQREAFEKRYAVLDLTRSHDDPFQDYKSGGTDILWKVWQAALASLPTMTEGELEGFIEDLQFKKDHHVRKSQGGFAARVPLKPKEITRALISRLPHIVRSE